MKITFPKVLVFTPIYDKKDYCFDRFLENCQKFTYKNYEHIIIDNTSDGGTYFNRLLEKCTPLGIKVYHTERGNSSREALARAQNFARKIFLDGDYDYLMSLESDIFPKPNIIDRFVLHNLDIVTAVYLIGDRSTEQVVPCITIDKKDPVLKTGGTRLLRREERIEYLNKGLKQVAAGGMGCCMMHRNVLEKIAFTYIPGLSAHSDVFFFATARRYHIPVLVDTDVYCEHENSNWKDVVDH
jgi:hypothetical protein